MTKSSLVLLFAGCNPAKLVCLEGSRVFRKTRQSVQWPVVRGIPEKCTRLGKSQ